jgi:cob(I)alamin adenosyltransferase
MIKINKVTTKMGDSGKTLGPRCEIIPKFDDRIEFLGKLDELNCLLGLVILDLEIDEMKKFMLGVQNQIFDIGAMFFKQISNAEKYITLLEENIEKYNENLPELDSFLLPSGSKIVVHLHLARAYARNAERKFWKANDSSDMKDIGIYLNRLSDLLFVFIRMHDNNSKWVPNSF